MLGLSKISWIALLASAYLGAAILSGCGSTTSGPPPAVSVTLSATSASIQAATAKQFTANLQNDSQNKGVTWSVTGSGCSGAACGTVSPASTLSGAATTYTAPANVPNPATLTLRATSAADSSRSASATITLIPAPTGVSVSPTVATLQITGTQQFTATVSPAAANQAVTWSLSGAGCTSAACGTLNSTTDNPVTYAVPTAVPNPATVSIIATAVGDPTQQASATITITPPPIVVDTRPGVADVPVNATQEFIVGVTNDPLDQGVTWTLTGTGCSGVACGTLSTTKTARLGYTFYTAPPSIPSPAMVTLTARSVTFPGSSGSATITITPADNALMNGRFAFVFNGFDSDGQLAMAGSFNADGAGNITGGIEDINRTASTTGASPLSFTGTYVIGTNNKGQMTLTSSKGSATFHFVIDSTGSKASFIEFDDITGTGTRGSGSMQKQDAVAFSLAQTKGDFVMGLFGDLPGAGRTGIVGRFNTSSTGAVSGAVMDFSIPGTNFPNVAWSGSVAAPDSTKGRGTMTLNVTIPAPGPGAITLNFAYYIIATNKLFVLGTDTRSSTMPLLSGHVHRQVIPGGGFTNASLSGKVIFALEGVTGGTGSIAVGQATLDGSGNLTGILDQNDGGTIVLNIPFTGIYIVSPNGRTTIPGPTSMNPQVLYLESPNRGFILEAAGSEVTFGEIQPQAAGPFSAASLSGTFGENTGPPPVSIYQDTNGLSTLDGISSFSFTLDTSDTEQFLRTKIRSGTYTVDLNGRGTMSFPGYELVFWIVSPNEFLCIFTVAQTPVLDTNPAFAEFFKP
jgi:hypothetical protein